MRSKTSSKPSLDRAVLSAPAETLDSGHTAAAPDVARPDEQSELVNNKTDDQQKVKTETVWERIKYICRFVKTLCKLAVEDVTVLMQRNSAEHHEIVEQIQNEIRTKMAAKLKWVYMYIFI